MFFADRGQKKYKEKEKKMKTKKLLAVATSIMMCTSFATAFTSSPVFAAETTSNTQTENGFQIYPELVRKGNDQYSNIRVSYFGKGADKLEKEDGLTIAYRVKYKGKWFGWTPLNAYVSDQKDGKSTIIQDYVSDEVQFCVTKQPYPKIPAYTQDLSKAGYNEAITAPIALNNPDENKAYSPAPYVIHATPAFTQTFNVSKTKTAKVTLKYNEQLKVDGTPSVTVSATPASLNSKVSNLTFKNGTENVQTGDIHWQRDYSIVTFDMQLDDVYDAQFANFNFQINGLVGVNSQKAPNSFTYTTSFYDCKDQISPFCYSWGSMNTKIYMSPSQPIADVAINPYNFYYSKSNFDQFTTNIFLVAQKDNGQATTVALKYNQSQAVAKLDQNFQATLAVPYPDGFNPNQSNVTFHAYKLVNEDEGSIDAKINVTELPTRITSKGLEVSQGTFGFEK